jgi:hypothetical protein
MRMRALPFERPKLAAVLTASLSGEEFGNQLEAARKRPKHHQGVEAFKTANGIV